MRRTASDVVADYSPADGGDLAKVANDGGSVPRPGDVLSMGSLWGEGHTAVVTAVHVTGGNGTIDILEQNMNGGNGRNTLGVVDDVVGPDYSMPVTGWLQAPPESAARARRWPRTPILLRRISSLTADSTTPGRAPGTRRAVRTFAWR